ncbi:hypothetical protein [Tenacibaculum sp. 190524A05c]|uniref:Lipoprotein n=1 Tax=Tenacibaculum platacis TaxID=3137852 RepID=A0ABM9P5J6_9FLAO
MKYWFMLFVLFLSCNNKKKINFELAELKKIKNIIADTEKIEKEILIKETYRNLKVQFGTNGEKISLFYSKLNENDEVFSYIESIDSIPGIDVDKTKLLKKNIFFLHKKGLSYQDFFYCDGGLKDFYVYQNADNENSEPENILYFSVLSKETISDKCFMSLFEIIEEKEGVYLLKRTNW